MSHEVKEDKSEEKENDDQKLKADQNRDEESKENNLGEES